MAQRIAVTGANSALGRVLLQRAVARADVEIVALVRSERAEAELPALSRDRLRTARVDFRDAAGLRKACAGAVGLIHLAGILIESRKTSYGEANVETTRAAIAAARESNVPKLVLVSAIGADARSANPYWRSKGEAESLVRESGIDYTIVRCPLLLGCDGAGDRALAREVAAKIVPLPGGGANLEQPLDARDLSDGLLNAALSRDCARSLVLDAVGPESLPLRELVKRGARLRKTYPIILPVPIELLRAVLALRTRLFGPGFSPEVIEVMLADTKLDPVPAATALGIALRPLDETLAQSLALASAA